MSPFRGMIASTALAALGVIGSPEHGDAQPSLNTGARVRASAPDLGLRARRGTLVELTSDILTLAFPEKVGGERAWDTRTVAIPLERITRLEVSVGRRRAIGFARGAGIGLLVGGLVGFVVVRSHAQPGMFSDVFVAAGATAGLLLGGVIGLGTAPDVWQEVPLPP